MENMSIYSKFATVPKEAQKPIAAGRLKGMTDINPMWRIKVLTEAFGACGFGWYYEVTDQRTEVVGNEVCAFVDINLYINDKDLGWSRPIHGCGGSKLATVERNGVYVSDECYKMATTDALSVACKQLGIGADVYWAAGRSKYSLAKESEDANASNKPKQAVKETKPKTDKERVISHIKKHYPEESKQAQILLRYEVESLDKLSADNVKDYMACIAKKGGNIDE